MNRRKIPPDPPEIRGIETRKELLAVADLYGKAFTGYESHYRNYVDLLTHRVPREQWRLSRTMWLPDGTPIAHVRIADRTMRLGSVMLRVAGIGDVCTHPFHRKAGLMRRLFAHLVEFMREERYDLSMLWGIAKFYDKFGFIVGLTQDWFQVSREQVARLKAPYRGRRARRTDAQAVLELFRDDLGTRTGAMERWGDVWLTRALREKCCRIIEDGQGRPRAYYRGGPRDDAFVLSEVSLGPRPDEAAIVSVIADLVKVAEACEKPRLRFELPIDHPLGEFCFADGCETHRTGWHRGGGMVRIANLDALCRHMAPEWERLLSHRLPACEGKPSDTGKMPVPPGWTGRLRLETDPSASLRAGMGTMDLAIARGTVRPEPPVGRAAAVLAADQGRLCRLILGYHTPAAAALLGHIRLTRAAEPIAAALFPRRDLAVFPADRF